LNFSGSRKKCADLSRAPKAGRTITITGPELDRFEAAGYLDPEKRGDRTAKAITVEAFITDYLP
jgi:hypothetical protein